MRNLFRLNIENNAINNRIIGDIRNLYRLKKENEAIKNRVIRDITNLFEHKEEGNYYKPVRVGNFWSNNYIGYESNGDRKKRLTVKEYLNKIRPYLTDTINHLKKTDTWKSSN